MALFAELGADGIAMIIAAAGLAVGGIVMPIVNAVLAYKREGRAIEREKIVAAKVVEVAVHAEDVKNTLAETTTTLIRGQSDLADKVSEVKKVADGLSDKRADEAGEAGFARGVKSETDKK